MYFYKYMNLKNIHIFFLLLTLPALSCSAQPPNLPGKYKAGKISLMSKAKLLLNGKYKYIVSTTLTLKENHSFHFSACGVESEGEWILSQDTLYLSHLQIKESLPDSTRNYLPEKYFYTTNNCLVGINENEYIEILGKQEE